MLDTNRSRLTDVGTVEPVATLGSGGGVSAPWPAMTPAIKAKLQELQPGEVLLVSINDPLARVDVPAWCALTGNILQATAVGDGGVLQFFIRKKSDSHK